MDTQAPRDDIATIQQDEYFNLWATTKTGHLLVRRDGTADWVDARVDVSGAIGISTAPGHSLFVSQRSHVIRRFVDGADGPVEIGKPIPYYARRVLVDQRGNVWVGTPQGGVHFLGPLSALMANSEPLLQDEKMDLADGLTGMFASTYQDQCLDRHRSRRGPLLSIAVFPTAAPHRHYHDINRTDQLRRRVDRQRKFFHVPLRAWRAETN